MSGTTGGTTGTFPPDTGITGAGTREAQVTRLYDTVFDRAPDSAGLAFWTAFLNQGGTLDTVADLFVRSQEFQGLGALGDADFVGLVYRNGLERAADAPGLDFWTGGLGRGVVDRGGVALAISETAEGVASSLARGTGAGTGTDATGTGTSTSDGADAAGANGAGTTGTGTDGTGADGTGATGAAGAGTTGTGAQTADGAGATGTQAADASAGTGTGLDGSGADATGAGAGIGTAGTGTQAADGTGATDTQTAGGSTGAGTGTTGTGTDDTGAGGTSAGTQTADSATGVGSGIGTTGTGTGAQTAGAGGATGDLGDDASGFVQIRTPDDELLTVRVVGEDLPVGSEVVAAAPAGDSLDAVAFLDGAQEAALLSSPDWFMG